MVSSMNTNDGSIMGLAQAMLVGGGVASDCGGVAGIPVVIGATL